MQLNSDSSAVLLSSISPRQTRNTARSVFALMAGLVALSLSGCGKPNEQKKPPVPRVTVGAVTTMNFVDHIEAVGTARANEQVTLAAPVTERITRLNFDDGGFVRQGQVIAELARAQEMAQLADADAKAYEASSQLKRLQTLKARGFATNAGVDAQYAAAASAKAQAAEAHAMIGDRVIKAPFSGYVSLRTISQGAVVQAGTTIATISDISLIKLDFPLPETVLASIRPGQAITAISMAYPDAPFSGRVATIDPVIDAATRSVQVRAILPNGDRRLRPGMLLTVGINTSSRTALAVPEPAVVGEGDTRFVFLVEKGKAKPPKAGAGEEPGKEKSKGNSEVVRRVAVQTGSRAGGMIEIRSGLVAGQKVVVEGVGKVTDGKPVRTGPSAAAR